VRLGALSAPDGNLAPPGQIGWSGQNWYERPSGHTPTIHIIERPSESYDAYHERKKREEDKPRVPFGFARVLVEDQA
jgi:hypothetical protein